MNNTVKIFQLPDISLSAGSKTFMVTRIWDTVLKSNTMTSYTDVAALMKQQNIPPIFGWEAEAKILDQWLIVAMVLLGTQERHPAVFELATLLAAAEELSSRL